VANETIKLTIAKLIKRHRLALNMTQVEVARHMGYSNGQMIYAIEDGLSRLPKEKILRLCELLRISPTMIADLLVQEAEEKIRKDIGL